MNSMQNRNRSAVRRHKGTCIAASAISDVFSPLLMATYAMAVALWLTPMAYLPLGVRAWSTVGVFFITAVIPASTVFVLMKMGRVSDASISDRRERPLPFIVAVLCYCGAWLYLCALNAPRWMLCFMAAAAAVALMELLISFFWKISAHTGAAAGLAALVFWLASRGALRIDDFAAVSATVVVLAAVAWARLWLRRHTPAQVLAGAAAAFLIVYLILHNFSI